MTHGWKKIYQFRITCHILPATIQQFMVCAESRLSEDNWVAQLDKNVVLPLTSIVVLRKVCGRDQHQPFKLTKSNVQTVISTCFLFGKEVLVVKLLSRCCFNMFQPTWLTLSGQENDLWVARNPQRSFHRHTSCISAGRRVSVGVTLTWKIRRQHSVQPGRCSH